MDKYDLVFDVIEHPEKYSAEKIGEFLSDPEFKKIYELICKTASSAKQSEEVDTNSEWNRFVKERIVPRAPRRFLGLSVRAASIIIFFSVTLFATAIGLVLTQRTTEMSVEDSLDAPELSIETQPVSSQTESEDRDTESEVKVTGIMTFENASLREIMNTVGHNYGMEVLFNDPVIANLHLYYKFNPDLTLEEVLGQLNNFEQINISQDGKNIIVE